jgi:hypothetical protein
MLVAVTALALSGAAFASEITDFPIGESVRSRAEVRAEFEQARAWDQLPFGELGQTVQPGASIATRAQVAGEAAEAQRLGLLPVGDSNARMPTAEERSRLREAAQRAVQQAWVK